MSAMNALATLAIAYSGFVALGLAMDRHQRQMLGRDLPAAFTPALRIAGGALLPGSLQVACRGTASTSVGILWWLGLLSLAGMALGVLLAYRPHWARRLGFSVLPLLAFAWIAESRL